MPPAAKPVAPRRRNRKRKRRAASSSSSSSSSSESDSEQETQPKKLIAKPTPEAESSSSSSSSSESDSDSSSDENTVVRGRTTTIAQNARNQQPKAQAREPSASPPPPSAEIPSFLNSSDQKEEQQMKEKFRKFWLATVADGFKDDLEEIRKEPNLGTSRLALLIDSLASGADVFATENGASEMDIVLN